MKVSEITKSSQMKTIRYGAANLKELQMGAAPACHQAALQGPLLSPCLCSRYHGRDTEKPRPGMSSSVSGGMQIKTAQMRIEAFIQRLLWQESQPTS